MPTTLSDDDGDSKSHEQEFVAFVTNYMPRDFSDSKEKGNIDSN